jgi:3-phenylpropionate/trans-cinnamate dioxygenase ferredoxin reductase component
VFSGQTIAIVGANLAGGRAAEALRQAGFGGRVLLIGAEDDPPYERPPLSKEILKGTMPAERTYLRPPGTWAADDIELRLGTTVTRIRPGERAVELHTGERVRADQVLLCTGGRVRRLPVPGADLDGVHYLRTLRDAAAIADSLTPDAPVVVIGAGFVGAEVAACAREAGCLVTLLEAAEVPLLRVLGKAIGRLYARYHIERGVDLRTGVTVEAIEGDGRVRAVRLADGTRLEASCVVIGVGIEPNLELAQDAGIRTGNGIVVDEFCRTSLEGVYAAGDVAWFPNPVFGQPMRLEHWQNAQNQAVSAARSMLGERTPFAEVPWFWSDQFDLNLQLAGHPAATDDLVVRDRTDRTDRAGFSAFYLREGTLTGALAVNRPRDVREAMRLIQRRARPERAQLADPDVPLRSLAAVPSG